jgi:filamin
LDGNVHDNGDGTYSVDYEPQEEGEHQVAVTLEGNPIQGSAFHVPTVVATASGAQSEAEGKGLKKAVVGHRSPFLVTLKDNRGQLVRGGKKNIVTS